MPFVGPLLSVFGIIFDIFLVKTEPYNRFLGNSPVESDPQTLINLTSTSISASLITIRACLVVGACLVVCCCLVVCFCSLFWACSSPRACSSPQACSSPRACSSSPVLSTSLEGSGSIWARTGWFEGGKRPIYTPNYPLKI